MHTLSLKLQENIFSETDRTARTLKISRNAYINEALKMYNTYHHQCTLKGRLARESSIVAAESMNVLREFDRSAGGAITG
jgi:hypothetical protein